MSVFCLFYFSYMGEQSDMVVLLYKQMIEITARM